MPTGPSAAEVSFSSLRQVIDALGDLVGADVRLHHVVNDKGASLALRSAEGLDASQREQVEQLPTGDGIWGEALATGRPQVLRGADAQPGAADGHPLGGVSAAVCVPLGAHDGPAGTVTLGWRTGGVEDRALETLESIAALLSAAAEHDHARQELTAKEHRQSAIFSRAAVGLCELSLEGRFLRVNDELARILGRPAATLLTLGATDVTHPDDVQHSVDAIQRVVQKGAPASLDKRYVHPDGTIVFANSIVTLLPDEHGQPDRLLVVTVDLTERRQTEERLRASEARLQQLADAMPQLVWTANPTGEVEYYNVRVQEYSGIERQPDGTWTWEPVVHEDDAASTSDAWQHALATGSLYVCEHRIRMADGTYRWHLSRAVPVEEDSRVVRWQGTATDVHDLKVAEQNVRHSERQLRELSRSLEERVAQRTDELRQQAMRLRSVANELTSAEHRERKRLAAMLHDDLQQLLVAAKMRLGQAQLRKDAASTARAVTAAAEMLDLAIASSRDLTRQLRPPVLYEDGLVPALRWLGQEMAQRHDLAVTVDADDDPLPLSDDVRALLYESVRELLFNIVKHAGVGEARIVVTPEDDRLTLVVSDQGVGFDVPEVEQRGASDALGLFSVRERLAALGGVTSVRSSPEGGTSIQLEVPMTRAAARTDAEAGFGAADGSRGNDVDPKAGRRAIRIVVVDDHPVVREGIATLLRTDPRLNVVDQAGDGVEAIDVVDRRRPDVVLVDVNMPRMNGVETTREIRRRWPAVHVIGLSVQDDEATARSMRDAGAAAFVSKSDSADHVVATITGLVGVR